jgi:hypothetical protein
LVDMPPHSRRHYEHLLDLIGAALHERVLSLREGELEPAGAPA